MKNILILKNIQREGPGVITERFREIGYTYEILELSDEIVFPDLLIHYDGLIVLGGPASANDKTFVMQRQIEFVKNWLATGKPYLGVCLGMQVMVAALNGLVLPAQVKEIGFNHLDNIEEPYFVQLEDLPNHPLKEILPQEFPVFQLHGETVLSDSISSMAKSKWCNYQIVVASSYQIGVQFHLEITEDILKEWVLRDDDLLFVDKNQYLNDYRKRANDMKKNCYALVDYVFLNDSKY